MQQKNVLNPAVQDLPVSFPAKDAHAAPTVRGQACRLSPAPPPGGTFFLFVKLIIVSKVCDFYLKQTELRPLAIFKDRGVDNMDGQEFFKKKKKEFFKMPGENNSEYGNLSCLVKGSHDVTIIRLGFREGCFRYCSE